MNSYFYQGYLGKRRRRLTHSCTIPSELNRCVLQRSLRLVSEELQQGDYKEDRRESEAAPLSFIFCIEKQDVVTENHFWANSHRPTGEWQEYVL